MTAQTQPPSSKPQDDNSYVDDYQPPAKDVSLPGDPPAPAPIDPTPTPATIDPVPTPAPIEPAPVPAVPEDKPAAITPKDQETAAEALEDQNIFFLLGVEDSSEEEKEAFLDELQQVIWEDFIEIDVKSLITPEEFDQLKAIMNKGDGVEVQEEMVVFLEKLIPDLEKIMLEKALELKEEMVMERIAGMSEYYLGKEEQLAKINQAKELISKDKWHQGAKLLNSVKP